MVDTWIQQTGDRQNDLIIGVGHLLVQIKGSQDQGALLEIRDGPGMLHIKVVNTCGCGDAEDWR